MSRILHVNYCDCELSRLQRLKPAQCCCWLIIPKTVRFTE